MDWIGKAKVGLCCGWIAPQWRLLCGCFLRPGLESIRFGSMWPMILGVVWKGMYVMLCACGVEGVVGFLDTPPDSNRSGRKVFFLLFLVTKRLLIRCVEDSFFCIMIWVWL
jgi:hypothetical protein